ncbi:MAG: hypothetical protein QXU31_08275 [Archaeoglobaceae archaeon]|nr:hypothetical protein [Archaeoglobales archaeon]
MKRSAIGGAIVIIASLVLFLIATQEGLIETFNSRDSNQIPETSMIDRETWQNLNQSAIPTSEHVKTPSANISELGDFEEMKQRLITVFERMIEKLQEQGDLQDLTKLRETYEKIKSAETIDELRKVMEELREIMPLERPTEHPKS